MRVIKATTDQQIFIVDVDFSDMNTVYNEIGGFEVVRTVDLVLFFHERVVMLVDDDGFAKNKPLNVIGSVFYGGDIVGDVLFVPEVDGEFVDFDDIDAQLVHMRSFL